MKINLWKDFFKLKGEVKMKWDEAFELLKKGKLVKRFHWVNKYLVLLPLMDYICACQLASTVNPGSPNFNCGAQLFLISDFDSDDWQEMELGYLSSEEAIKLAEQSMAQTASQSAILQ